MARKIEIFTDGACSGNPGAAAIAFVIKEGGKNIKLKLTPGTKFFASEGGKEVKAADLVGKSVKVVSEHKKVDSITGA